MIEDRKLKAGTVLAAKYKGKEHRCEVVAGEAGRVRYRLADGREFTSPSGAGSAVMGGTACNGWRFWSLAAGGAAVRAETKPAKGPTKKRTRSARVLPKTKPHGRAKVGRNGHTADARWSGRGSR